MATAPKTRLTTTAKQSKNRSGDPFYSSATWIKLRDAKRQKSPLCQECLKQGIVKAMEEVDHIVPRSQRPDLGLRMANLQSLCKSCHGHKTMREATGRGM